MSHTPGPWKVGESQTFAAVWGKGAYEHIASCGNLTPETEANARLIAAAPEMLALLKRVPGNGAAPDDLRGWEAEIRALLAKIEGR